MSPSGVSDPSTAEAVLFTFEAEIFKNSLFPPLPLVTRTDRASELKDKREKKKISDERDEWRKEEKYVRLKR